MKRSIIVAVLAMTASAVLAPAFVPSAAAQVPPRNGAWGDRDHDGIPNAYDRRDNRQQAWDKDHDGVPNRYDRFDNRKMQDRDHDGVPRAFDRNDRNPYR